MIHIFLNRRRVETKILNITILNPSDDSDSLEHFSYSSVPFIKVCYLKFYKAASIVERRKGYFSVSGKEFVCINRFSCS